jgi:hypothetical protein
VAVPPREFIRDRSPNWGCAPSTTAETADPLDVIREAFEEIEPEALKAFIKKAVLEGRDVRALMAILDRAYAVSKQVEIPTSLDKLDDYTAEERRTLLSQIEGKLGPTIVDCPHCGGPLLAQDLPDDAEAGPRAG